MESILTSIKKLLGITEECKDFDDDIIIHINSVFMILTQLGVGPVEGFEIEDDIATWNMFIQEDKKLKGIKTYVYQKVKLLFDPPSGSAHLQALKDSVDEFEWRLRLQAESK